MAAALRRVAAGVAARLGLALVLLPILAGLGFTLTEAQGDWGQAFRLPGLPRALALSLIPGLAATLIATGLTGLILALSPPGTRLLTRLLAPFLALPHAALGLGLGFLIAPSGLIARALAPLMGWSAPPDLATLQDRWGIGLTLGLVLKETPFLMFLALAARTPAIKRMGTIAATFGHGRALRFALIEWPALYPSLRLPVLAVLTYGMTTVDMGAILGPTLPAPLSVEITRAATRPDLTGEGLAAALALIQLALTLAAIALWLGVERLGRRLSDALIARGARGRQLDAPLMALTTLATLVLTLVPLAALVVLALWTLTPRWPFAQVIPPMSLAPLTQTLPALAPLAATTLGLALASACAALILCLITLQARPTRAEALIWLPLILPQVVFLPGLARALIPTGLPAWPATTLAHLIFVLPYVWLGLSGPWRQWNPRLAQVAATLGASGPRVLFRLRLPMLAPVLAASLAIGIATSGGQYLATLLISGGRLATLTTEAVALASGPDRARVAALALAQAALPLVAFALAARLRTAGPRQSLPFPPSLSFPPRTP